MNNLDKQYTALLQDILDNGVTKNDRTGTGTISVFGRQIRHRMNEGFPLITTKKMFFKGIVEELLWFLKGSVNSKILEEKGVNIWKKNSSREYLDSIGFNNYEEGYLGPIYGFQWRSFNGDIDQLRYILEELEKENSRRIIINAWNPCQLSLQALPPCHILYNFFKNNDELSCMMYMRSSDLFLGLPFNIASYSLLTIMIASMTGYQKGKLYISFGDTHIYKNHIEQVKEQLNRTTRCYPSLEVLNIPENIEEWEYDMFKLVGYNPHPIIKGVMAV